MSARSIGRRIVNLLTRSSLSCGDSGAGKQVSGPAPFNPSKAGDREEIYKWISDGIASFREWYQPVDFGNNVIAHQTLPPDWHPAPELLHDVGGGLAKWNYIVKRHIPDVSGRRVLDLGCSSGLFSIELARMGAREVVGIDRNAEIQHRSSSIPPQQDVIAQAKFVKSAFELLDGSTYPIRFIAHDIGRLEELGLGRFDLVIALCVVYHELDRMPELVRKLAGMTNHLVLQANNVHGGELGKYSNADYHVALLKKVGYTYVETDAPEGYLLPLVVARA